MKRLFLFPVILLVLPFFLSAQSTAKEWYDKGMSLIKAKDSKGALSAFNNAIAIKAEYGDANYQAGWCCNELEKYQDAITYLEKAKQLLPDKAKVYFELGYAYNYSENTDKAITNYKKSLELYPEYYDAAKALGDIYYKKGDYANAVPNFRKYLDGEKDPDDSYYYKMGWSLSDIEKYEDALIYLEKYSPENTEDKAKKNTEIGYANFKLKKYDEAIEYYKLAIQLKEGYGTALRGLANVYYEKNDHDNALYYFKEAVEKDEENSKSCYYKMGWIYNDKENYDDAVSVLLKSVNYDSEVAGTREELGYAYYMKDRYDDAIYQLNKAIELDPKSKLGYYYKGLCYISMKRKTDAMSIYNELKVINEEQASKLLAKINAM